MRIESYQFGEAERLRYGKFPVLDTVLARWSRAIEECLFEQLRLEAYAGASLVEEMRFAAFFASLKRPRPIYFFELTPFAGSALLVLDNRFSQACLAGQARPTEPDSAGNTRLTPENHVKLQRMVHLLMERFDQCWQDVHAVQSRLQKVTTYLFRARILSPYESCLVAQLHLSGQAFSSRLMLCLPRVMLEPVLPRLQNRSLVPSLVPGRTQAPPGQADLLRQLPYQAGLSLGTIVATLGSADFKVGSVFPLRNEVGGEGVLEINGTPYLVGEVGQSDGRYALRVTGSYAERRVSASQRRAMEPIAWPAIQDSGRAR